MRLVLIGFAVWLALVAACADEDLVLRTPASEAPATSPPGLAASAPRSLVVRVTALSAAARVQPQPPLFYRIEVRDGDTVEGVARQFGLRPEYVLWNNQDTRAIVGGELVPGSLLELPSSDGILHRIQLGETLSEIAARYGVEVQVILDVPANGLASPRAPGSGGVILVPGGRKR